MNGDAKQMRTKAIKSQCQRGTHTSFKNILTLIAGSYNARILIVIAPTHCCYDISIVKSIPYCDWRHTRLQQLGPVTQLLPSMSWFCHTTPLLLACTER